jgi:sec-independent protein translocase protein TatC
MSEPDKPDEIPPDEPVAEGSLVKPFLEHLEDLRWMLIKMIVALVVAMFGSFFFAGQLLGIVIWPLQRVTGDPKPYLRTLEVTGGFMVAMKLAFWSGLVFSCPLLLYFLSQFLLPALTQRERKLLGPSFTAGAFLFLAGAALCYFVALPAGLKFFISYNDYLGIGTSWTIDNYVSFVGWMVLAFGVSFELPLVILVLALLGLVTHAFLREKRPYAIIVIFIFAAIITPTTDPVNQTILALPMCVLYEICIWVAWWMERRRKRGS